MNKRMLSRLLLSVSAALILLPSTAQAYVGPGGVISAIGAMFALLAAIMASIVGFLWFPLKRFLIWIKGAGVKGEAEGPAGTSTEGSLQ